MFQLPRSYSAVFRITRIRSLGSKATPKSVVWSPAAAAFKSRHVVGLRTGSWGVWANVKSGPSLSATPLVSISRGYAGKF